MIVTAIIIFAVIFIFALAGGFYLFLVKGVNQQFVGSLVFGIIGVLLIGLGFVIAWDNYQFMQQAESASAEVTSDGKSLVPDSDRKLVVIYAPEVRFTTSRGEIIKFYGASSSYREYEQGERVSVLYLPEQPEQARIKSFDWHWLTAAALAVMGIIFTGIAVRVGFAYSKTAKQITRTETRKLRGRGL